jgi:hypothetical protein
MRRVVALPPAELRARWNDAFVSAVRRMPQTELEIVSQCRRCRLTRKCHMCYVDREPDTPALPGVFEGIAVLCSACEDVLVPMNRKNDESGNQENSDDPNRS